jgi:hypothetical protein
MRDKLNAGLGEFGQDKERPGRVMILEILSQAKATPDKHFLGQYIAKEYCPRKPFS